jgi:hypothetical protein
MFEEFATEMISKEDASPPTKKMPYQSRLF